MYQFLFCFFIYTATTQIYTLSLHDALPISTDSIIESQGIVILAYFDGSLTARAVRQNTGSDHRVIEPAPPDVVFRQLSRSEEHTSELQSLTNLVCRLLLEKKNS